MNQLALGLHIENQLNQELKLKFARSRARYIGSKSRVANRILEIIGRPKSDQIRFVDAFCGSGAISVAAAMNGWTVHANDHLKCSTVMTRAQLLSESSVTFSAVGGYENAVRHLAFSSSIEGPIFSEYSPSGRSRSGHLRKYFTESNAAKIDGVRAEIGRLAAEKIISDDEKILLIADLITAANSVANIAGTYGCFLSKWSNASLANLSLKPRLLGADMPKSTATCLDVCEFSDAEEDVLYCDPPYTKRQYAAYYHLLETITLGDYPDVTGVAGIRSWHSKSSPFCFKRKALRAFSDLLASKRAKTVYVSYSSEGHLSIEALRSHLENFGTLRVHSIQSIPRYTPNVVSRSNGSDVTEFLFELRR